MSSAFRAFFVLSKLFSGLEQARAWQRLCKHFGRGEIMRHPGNAQLEVGQQGERSCGAKLGFADGLAFSHCRHDIIKALRAFSGSSHDLEASEEVLGSR